MTFNEVMNGSLMYGLVIAGIIFILLFCLVTFKKAYSRAIEIGMDKSKLKNVITSSIIYSIVPSLSIVIGLVSLSTVIGVPWAWFRLSVVGAVAYELMTADMVATGMGYESIAALNATGGAEAAGVVMFVMSGCILGGMVAILFFGKKINTTLSNIKGKNGELGTLMVGVLSLALIEVFLPIQLTKSAVHAAVLLTSIVIVVLHQVIIKKFGWRWLGNFVMADTLILGMASSLLWTQILG